MSLKNQITIQDMKKIEEDGGIIICSFYEYDIAIMERIICKIDKPNMHIVVFPREGDTVPHFHVMRNNETLACVKILEPEYFKHGRHQGTLKRKDVIALNDKLHEIQNGREIYYKIIKEWNDHINIVRYKVSETIPIPNYIELYK